ncbi:malonic semialdehyde reductase [Sciscionella sediminilitoris]|uniref:malonic semialdehyde reductase n=1 Tax=Sciscionella sediminilitoris TaxID=1445613 RepID=UPI0004DF1708|nr:malonic semialdehyde reductase [Sciscionella sp. SE31]
MTTATELLSIPAEVQDLLFREARTANTFTEEPVSEEQLRAIYDLVKWGPTSMNQQPLRVVLVRSEEARQRLLPHLMEGNRAKTERAPLTALLAADTEFHERLPEVFPHNPDAKNLFAGNEDLRHTNAKLNASLQVAYFIIGVRAAGLAAGPMTGFDGAGIAEEFFPGGTQHPLVAINIGKPGEDAWFGRLPRLSYEDVVTTV